MSSAVSKIIIGIFCLKTLKIPVYFDSDEVFYIIALDKSQ